MKELKRYGIKSKVTGKLLVFKTKVETDVRVDIDYDWDDNMFEDYSCEETTTYILSSNTEQYCIWYTNRKEIAEKIIRTIDKRRETTVEIPMIEKSYYETKDSFEIVEIKISF